MYSKENTKFFVNDPVRTTFFIPKRLFIVFFPQFATMESQFNSSDRERRALKAQNESLSSMNDRLRTEQEILHRQKSGSDLLTENLKLLQHQLEKTQSAERMRLENEATETKAEVALLRKKNEKDTAEFMGSMKAWEATQAELRAALEASKEAERDAIDKVSQSTAAIEDLNQVNKSKEPSSVPLEFTPKQS